MPPSLSFGFPLSYSFSFHGAISMTQEVLGQGAAHNGQEQDGLLQNPHASGGNPGETGCVSVGILVLVSPIAVTN